MGKGRPPKPLARHLSEGTYRKHRHADRNAEIEATGHPTMPSWLDGQARNWWRRNVPKLIKLRVVTQNDSDALTQAALCWQEWMRWKDITATDPTTKNLDAFLKATRQYQNVASKFGMSPVDRCKIKLDVPREEIDPLLEMLKQRQSNN